MPSDETIVINIYDNLMTHGCYNICASYSDDPYTRTTYGWGHARKGTFYDLLGIGDSLETSMKKGTCAAIKELKEEYEKYEAKLKRIHDMETLCHNHILNCGDNK